MTTEFPLSAWQAETFRLTVFTRDVVPQERGGTWWRSIVDSMPEASTNKPALGSFSSEGPVDGAKLVLNISPGRVDWFTVPMASDGTVLPRMGQLRERHDLFFGRIIGWLQPPPMSVNRIAFGGVAQFLVPNKVAGYKVLENILKNVHIDVENSHDLLYQVNRPRASKIVNGLRINRLGRWSVMEIRAFQIGSPAMTSIEHFVRLEFDVNTDQNSDQDLTGHLQPLFKELVALGHEIVERGDIE